jgi:hypothetical protein
VTDSLPKGVSIYGNLTLNVYEAPTITIPKKATFPTGLPGSFTVTTTGFPSLSARPVAQPSTPPTTPNEGKGMYFTVTGLPASLKASNLNPEGFATGTLTIAGTPAPGDAGLRMVEIMARNGVGATAHQNLRLNLVKPSPAPASGNECNGAYNSVFPGDIRVSADQICVFIGGVVIGNVTVIGGDFTLSHAKVTGNVRIQGWSEFSITAGSEIGGNLTIEDSTGVSGSPLCATRVAGDLLVSDNNIPIEIGLPQVFCPANALGGNAVITNNTGSIRVYANHIVKTLSCMGNVSIAGGGNLADKKEGQCAAF